ncbi:hypothetical protein WJX81_003381 [Elliptochloris bilobata]|uniref:Glycosyltransferase n=1 Tax=Elliptochloris bilobata TaxID=381761 RepID=A0AAW1QJ91_9CHLO
MRAYSTFTCAGRAYDELRFTEHYRTCKFDNVCLNLSSATILYFRGSTETLFYDSQARAHSTFPADFVNTGHRRMPPAEGMPWAPRVVDGLIPPDALWPHPVAALTSPNWSLGDNIGHYLFDFLSPVSNMLQLSGVFYHDFQLLLAAPQPKPGGWDMGYTLSRFLTPPDDARSLLRLISRHAGATAYLHLPEQPLQWSQFREAAYAALEVLDGADLEKMPIKSQLEAMARTTVLVTPCGGLAALLAFLPPCAATAIALNYYNTALYTSVQMEAIYHRNLADLDIQYFPVTLEDYVATSDRPACELLPNDPMHAAHGVLRDCNVRLADSGLGRLKCRGSHRTEICRQRANRLGPQWWQHSL